MTRQFQSFGDIFPNLVMHHEDKPRNIYFASLLPKVDGRAKRNLFTDLNTDLSAISRRLTDRLSNCLREGKEVETGERGREAAPSLLSNRSLSFLLPSKS